ncbi:O-methyltransferase gsfD [Pseudocercospora fuligena]|uniref:O-methyltransferase gsfD n=1 Tax=Pseudocercospora fuligena TaxID=685502 RepID=A0A8H6RD90_9PEZI|nr:O-methyltransferase gsfD [Pseudocercospora fuligena]
MQQSWAPAELAVATLACEMDIFKAIASSTKPQSIAEITKQAKGNDEMLVTKVVRHLAAHGMVDQLDIDSYGPNELTRDLTDTGRVGDKYTMLFTMKALAEMPYFFRENGYKVSTDPKNTVWQKTYDSRTMFEWLEGNPEQGKYFNDFMTIARSTDRDELAKLYPFEKLYEGTTPEDVLFVDVGGGFGHQCMNLRKSFPASKGRVVLQDLPFVVEGKQIPDVEVTAHDMMTEQPVKGARAYYFRGVCHDHPDENCRKFLSQIVKAMDKNSRVLIHDQLIEDLNPGQYITRADFVMMSLFGGQERSEAQMRNLLESVGLRVVGMHKPGPEQWTITEAML